MHTTGRASVEPLLRYGGRLAVGSAAASLLLLTIALAGPHLLRYRIAHVQTGSMSPAIPSGSLIVFQSVAAERLVFGDVIMVQHPGTGERITHRIVGVDEGGTSRSFVTQGDANPAPDAWRVVAAGSGWRYRAHLPRVGHLLRFAARPAIRVALFAAPALTLAAILLLDVWRPHRRPAGAM